MSLLSTAFGAAKPTYRARAQKAPAPQCLDHTLMPRWRGPQVMADDTQAMGFVCHLCGREYLPVEVENRRLIKQPGK